jgi:acyl-CoA synthetase (AMP-forming)/AMP-acid ligase II/heme oxygenase
VSTVSPIRLHDGTRPVEAQALHAAVQALVATLHDSGARRVATLLDNGPAWVALDLACREAELVHVPLPLFFTPAQIAHALQSAGIDRLVVAAVHAPRFAPAPAEALPLLGAALALIRLPALPMLLPEGTSKITFTSGTTGAPKGVCLSGAALREVVDGVREAMAPLAIDHHLCALPLAVLLENVAGLDAALAQGARCTVLPLAQLGFDGSSQFDAARFHATVAAQQPHSLILLPQMLRAWTAHLAATGQRVPASLRFVAVGGAAVGAAQLQAARAQGIPAYEGYGLSEGASVQTLNLPGHDRPGSAGRVLPHARLRVDAQGEIEVAGSLFLGYVGERTALPEWWPSGDLGEVDADGYVWVHGRRKHVLITAFGRNVSPEWVETALRSRPAVLQAVVFGDGQPALSAVLWPVTEAIDDAALQRAVDAANADLPDYARVRHWVRARAPFSAASGLATANGRPQRDAILRMHADALAIELPTEVPPMNFHQQLLAQTEEARRGLVGAPIIQGCLRGEVSLPSYLAFLREAYHHVRHTVPLLRACKAALPPRLHWLHSALDEYIDEEAGHDEWILDDIAACGGDAQAVRHGRPGHATEVMVAYAYDTIARGNPLGFFGMVHVLEGTSVSLALMAADAIQKPLGLPDRAFSYLRSHGTLDQEHTATFALLMDQIDDPQDQADIVHAARAFFRLYGDVFRSLPLPQTQRAAEEALA